ncbi:hypothetical protein DFH08DRAFT_917047 [Mycena albidolilacea]|uniref:P-loop containing nucleoside triphosphate hydrolase protein n=1 Tax=Mycena albidolilacea TaxID=1033008 RepID=A0AAD6ZI40_9AGAR|nr:hypothetical protein DFH08DRAFT_917047 [Mycena albidolilacea]
MRLRVLLFQKLPPDAPDLPDTRQTGSIHDHIAKHGGATIFAFKVLRLIGCLVLLGFSTALFALNKEEGEDIPQRPSRYIRSAICGIYLYVAVLAIFSVIGSVKWSRVAVKHLNLVLIPTAIVYFYRDVFPLATFPLTPKDLWEGALLWPKIATLFLVSGIVPLVIPRQYTPVDLKHPMPVPNPEQTASILSSVFFSFLDRIVALAYQTPHLSLDQLPPLCDYDDMKHLKTWAFPHLDVFISGKKRHVVFGFLWIFRWEFFTMAILLIIGALAQFGAPLAINRLLDYLENPDSETFMKPWFWILLLFFGPLTYILVFQWDMFVGWRVSAQATAIMTELIFEHALRIQLQAETASKDATVKESSAKAAQTNLVGKINTLVTVDREAITDARNILFLVTIVPIQVIGSAVFLYRVLGWSAFVGIGTMIALLPAPGYITKLQSSVQKKTLKQTDARVQTVTESEMFGWEKQMKERIAEKREAELTWIWWRKVLSTAQASVSLHFIENTHSIFSQTVVMKEELSASKVFSSMAVFDLLRNQLGFIFYSVSMVVKAKVSLDRLNDFLCNTELLNSFSPKYAPDIAAAGEPSVELIGLRDASFTWSNDNATDGTLIPSSRKFVLEIKGELFFKPGRINLVIGSTGSTGEMHQLPISPSSWFNLPRRGGVSYAAQESWVLNDTIKNNILFNTPMDVERYKQVLHQCGLERDLELFDAGDETEVGEKVGLPTSGGQKARVTLARAVYSDTQIILLDDILAALDVHTAKWIVDKCLCGPLIRNRTVILVTHNLALTSKLADFVVSVGLDGRVHTHSSVSNALVNDELLATEANKGQAILDSAENEVDSMPPSDEAKKAGGKLIIAEEIAIGRVSLSAIIMFLSAHATGYATLFFAGLITVNLVDNVVVALRAWYLGYWADQCSVLHSWLDVTPTSRIIARCTADINAVDDSLSEAVWNFLNITLTMVVNFSAVIFFTPLFILPGSLVTLLGIWCGRIYLASQLSVKREWSNARAPVLAHIGATIAGIVSVRAYGAQEALIKISIDRINALTRTERAFTNLNRWAFVRVGTSPPEFYISGVAYYLVYLQSHRPSNVGFSLNMALNFSGTILAWVFFGNRLEIQSNSLERIKQYIDIEQEPTPEPKGIPPAYWPASGNLDVNNLSARYSHDGPQVLHNISFNIKAGERVGVVGRTGSGKSSLTLALLRCILTEGTVHYDGIPTSSLNLEARRTNITIIPQVPELLAGSLRSNLNILSHFDDLALNDALRVAGLSALQDEMEEGNLTLDSEIAAGGSNLSVGQRQIIALDYKTDAIIQASLRTELPRDTTLLTVAHRLMTIMDADKIMVLDAGRIVEFDSPKVLLKNKDGIFRALVEESADKEVLYGMVRA